MSTKAVEYHQGAAADVKSAVASYRKRSPKAALDFIEELRRAADTIREAPERWPPRNNNTRKFQLWRFPFSVIYSESESVITIWAVAHGSWRPDYWTQRLYGSDACSSRVFEDELKNGGCPRFAFIFRGFLFPHSPVLNRHLPKNASVSKTISLLFCL